jgi:hypothetical protein
MRKHQLKLADRQCRMADLSLRIQNMVTILVTALFAGRSNNELVEQAGDVLCQDLKLRLSGGLPSDEYFRAVTRLGEHVAAGGFEAIAGIEAQEILMPYRNDPK